MDITRLEEISEGVGGETNRELTEEFDQRQLFLPAATIRIPGWWDVGSVRSSYLWVGS